MAWFDLLASDRIVRLVEPTSHEHVIDAAARLLGQGASMATPAIAAALHEREALGSTGIGRGVAIPHARAALFHAPRAAFLRLTRAVDFLSPDGQPVDLVLALCAPDDAPNAHLQHLAEIAGRFSEPAFLDALRDAPDVAALRKVLFDEPRPMFQVA